MPSSRSFWIIAAGATGAALALSGAVASSEAWNRPPAGATAPTCKMPGPPASRAPSVEGPDQCAKMGPTPGPAGQVVCKPGKELRVDAEGVVDWCFAPPTAAPKPAPTSLPPSVAFTCKGGFGRSLRAGDDVCARQNPCQAQPCETSHAPICPDGKVLRVDLSAILKLRG